MALYRTLTTGAEHLAGPVFARLGVGRLAVAAPID
jgi:hypothetical protein